MKRLELLISYTVVIMKALTQCYDSGRISYEVFERNVEIKIRFLSEHIDIISARQERADAEKVLDRCTGIFMNSQNGFNTCNILQ